jgi:hypothetical protein
MTVRQSESTRSPKSEGDSDNRLLPIAATRGPERGDE